MSILQTEAVWFVLDQHFQVFEIFSPSTLGHESVDSPTYITVNWPFSFFFIVGSQQFTQNFSPQGSLADPVVKKLNLVTLPTLKICGIQILNWEKHASYWQSALQDRIQKSFLQQMTIQFQSAGVKVQIFSIWIQRSKFSVFEKAWAYPSAISLQQ